MMTLITRLCALCAMSALMQMAIAEQKAKGSIRMICGLLMLRLTLTQLKMMGEQLAQQTDLRGIFDCLMR